MPITLKPLLAFTLAAIFILSVAVILPGCANRGGDASGFWQHKDRIRY